MMAVREKKRHIASLIVPAEERDKKMPANESAKRAKTE